MGNELIKASTGLEISLNYPDNIPASIIRAVAVPAAVKVVGEIAKSGIVATSVVVGTTTGKRGQPNHCFLRAKKAFEGRPRRLGKTGG